MSRNIILILSVGFLFISQALFSQDAEIGPLAKEVIKQSRGSGGTEWRNEERTVFQYDMFGNVILDQSSFWNDGLGSWIIRDEVISRFDRQGNRINYHTINYLDYPYVAEERIEKREYENGRIRYRDIIVRDYTNPTYVSQRDYDVFYDYNENGDRTQFLVKYDFGSGITGGYGWRRHFDSNFCRTAFVNFDINSSGEELPRDSTATLRDAFCNITQFGRYEFIFDRYYLINEQYYEYEYDSRNNITSQIEFTRTDVTQNWEKIAEYQHTYNESGLLISSHAVDILNNFEFLQDSDYDQKDRLIKSLTQFRENLQEEWTPINELIYAYNSNDQLERSEFYFDYNNSINVYESYVIRGHSFDIEGNNVQSTVERNIEGTITLSDLNRQFRCDGAVISAITDVKRIYEDFTTQSQEATLTTYLDGALCENIASVEPDFILYPNPAYEYFNIQNGSPTGSSLIRVINSRGETVKEFNGFLNNYFSVDVKGLDPGIYIVQVENDLGKSSRRFIKL